MLTFSPAVQCCTRDLGRLITGEKRNRVTVKHSSHGRTQIYILTYQILLVFKKFSSSSIKKTTVLECVNLELVYHLMYIPTF